MQLEECFLEMVCHSRWVFNYCLTRLPEETAERFADDLTLMRDALAVISTPHASDDEVLDIPALVVAALCRGVSYLLIGEDILGKAPPTMHPFLNQTANARKESSKQAQIIVVRWFINSGLMTIEELLAVIYGPETTVDNYESDYDAHMAVAVSLSSEEPFYLGAHVTILRALLLHYCTTVFTADDIINHVSRINPAAAADLYTLEDTLLFWIRTVLSLVPATAITDFLRDNISDLYLNTNDGRIISLVIHYYRPELLPFEDMHLIGVGDEGTATSATNASHDQDDDPEAVDIPLAGWQREANWSNIIAAAEALGLWVGVFSEEIVTHGFCTLQLHVLRAAEELFAVLAVGAEERIDEILEEADQKQQQENVRRSQHLGVGAMMNSNISVHNSLRNSQLVVSVKNSTAKQLVYPSSVAASAVMGTNGSVLEAEGAQRQQHNQNTFYNMSASPGSDLSGAGVSVELDNNTSLVMITNGNSPAKDSKRRGSYAAPPAATVASRPHERQQARDCDEDCGEVLVMNDGEEDREAEEQTARVITQSITDGYETLRSPAPWAAYQQNTLGEPRGASSSVHRQIFDGASPTPEPRTIRGVGMGSPGNSPTPPAAAGKGASSPPQPEDDPLASQRVGDYNIILTNMFLQGIAMPVKKRPQPPPAPQQGDAGGASTSSGPNQNASSSSAPPPTQRPSTQQGNNGGPAMSDEPTFSTRHTASSKGGRTVGGVASSTTKSLHDTQDLSAYVVRSSREDGVLVSQVVELTNAANNATNTNDLHSDCVIGAGDGPEMAIGTSPTKTDTTRPSTMQTGASTNPTAARSVAINDQQQQPAIKRSLQKLHDKPINMTSASTHRSSFMPAVVQGSIHKEGIADLINELKAMCDVPPPIAVGTTIGGGGNSSNAISAASSRSPSRVSISESSISPEATQRIREQNRELKRALLKQQQLVAAFLSKVQQSLSDPTSFREVVKQLGGGGVGGSGGNSPTMDFIGGGTSSPTARRASNAKVPAVMCSVGVGASFAGTSLLDSNSGRSGQSGGGGLLHQRASVNRLPKVDQTLDTDAAVSANHNRVVPLLSVSKLNSLQRSGYDSGSAGVSPQTGFNGTTPSVLGLGGTVGTVGGTVNSTNPLLSSTGSTVNGHRGPQGAQPLPLVRSLGGVAGATAVVPEKPPAPAVMDISIDTLKANPPTGNKPRAIPPRLAQRLQKANEAFDTKQAMQQQGGAVGNSPPRVQQQPPQQGRVLAIPTNPRSGAQQQQQQAVPPSSAHGSDASAPPTTGLPKLPAIQRKGSLSGAPQSGAVRTFNNKNNITNALKHALLSGTMNKQLLESVLTIMERCEADHVGGGEAGQLQFVILLKDEFAHAFKALYVLKQEGLLSRIYGVGPMTAYAGPAIASLPPNLQPPSTAVAEAAQQSAKLFPKYFKYDSGSKKFVVMHHKEANQTTDAVSFAKISHKINRQQVM